MAAELEGGCRVVGLKEGTPRHDGDRLIWDHFQGDKISLRVIEVNGNAMLRNETEDEVLYTLGANIGIHLPAGEQLPCQGKLTLVSVRTPANAGGKIKTVHLDDQPIQKTGDRWYRELIQGQTTQFVGSIPPGRAPDHFHLYEEVICILEGQGVMWAGAKSAPVAPGSCIFLPRKQRHCLENTGSGELRLLGVFYPAGSPAVRYPA